MKTTAKSVTIVLSDIAAPFLRELLDCSDVWIAKSVGNEAAIETVWAGRELAPFEGDLTIFNPQGGLLREQLAAVLELIEDHYNEFTDAGPWSRLELVGPLKLDDIVGLVDLEDGYRIRWLTDRLVVER